MEYLSLFVKGIFVENMIFAYFLGMCSYLAVSKTVKTAVGLGFAVIFVLGITVPINYLLENFVSSRRGRWPGSSPAYATVDLSFLSYIMFIAVIASMVQLVEMIVEKFAPALYGALGIFLPLIAVNCSILGGALFMQERQYPSIGEATVFGSGLRRGLAAGHCGHCRHPREDPLQQYPRSAQRAGHHLHPDRPHGHGLHGLHGH